MSNIILVTGATGNQGSAVVKALQESSFVIRALTRTIDSAKAKALQSQGIEVVQGDLDNLESLKSAMQGCYGVFSVQNFMDIGTTKETEQGCRVVEAATQTGIQHLVYSSVGGAERKSGVAHFESKRRIEECIIRSNIPYTIIRPSLFMDNFQGSFKMIMLTLVRSILKQRPVQMIARAIA